MFWTYSLYRHFSLDNKSTRKDEIWRDLLAGR